MHRTQLLNEEDNTQLRKFLTYAKLALANAEARRLQDVATAYAKRTPSQEGSASEGVSWYDMSPRGSDKSQPKWDVHKPSC